MRYFASVGSDLICRGTQTSVSEVIGTNIIEVTSEVESGIDHYDFLFRKYENGQWSTERFPSPAGITGPSAEEQIKVLDERTVGMQAIDDFTLQAQATIDDRTVGMQAIDDFTLEMVTDLQTQVSQLQADIAQLKGGA